MNKIATEQGVAADSLPALTRLVIGAPFGFGSIGGRRDRTPLNPRPFGGNMSQYQMIAKQKLRQRFFANIFRQLLLLSERDTMGG